MSKRITQNAVLLFWGNAAKSVASIKNRHKKITNKQASFFAD